MEASVIVDLSDDVEMENNRRKLDRKRFNEIKKYIPFLIFITTKDPVKNEKYVKLLQWFNSNKNLPARVATTCEFAINKRFRALQSSMVFPPHILSIFEGGGEAIDLVSDDDDQPITSKNNNTTNNSSKNIEVKQNANVTAEKPTNSKNASTTNTETSDPKPSTSSNKLNQNDSITSIITIEEGEISSDDENDVKDDQRTKETPSLPLSKISLDTPANSQTKSSVISEDDILNRDLFNRIDNLDGDSVEPIVTSELSWKDLEKEDSTQFKRSPILKPKNLESLSRKSPELSNISDDDETLHEAYVQRKKKRKRKHKKKTQNNQSETENNQSEKPKEQNENQTNNPRRPKKNSKKKKEKLKNTRPLYISDDEDEQSIPKDNDPLESVIVPESELFKRRDVLKTEAVPNENSPSDSNSVVLLDSDEDEISSSSKKTVEKNNEIKSSTILPAQPSPQETAIPSSNPIVEEITSSSSSNLLDKKNTVESASPSKLKDLNNMGLTELNDIYAKLCEKTGIQLEELLGDLVTKSSIPKEENSVMSNEDSLISSRDPSKCENNDMTEVCYDSYMVQEEQLQQHQQQQNLHHNQQYHQQNIHFQQQQERQQFEIHQQQLQKHQQQEFQNHMHCSSNQIQSNPQVSYPYQNSLMPRLNLNDPRIVQKLKQIKDSPIHNLSIRESATMLMNYYAERPVHRSLPPVVQPTSSTATTYGEHKRLKELEKLELERKAKQSKETEKSPSAVVVQEDTSEAAAIISKTNATNKKLRNDSSGSESGQKLNKLTQKKKGQITPNDTPSCSGVLIQSKTKGTPKRTTSSDLENGRNTPKSRTDTEEDEETVVMSFSGRPRLRQRIDSSSSTLTNDTEDLDHNTASLNTNNESNIRKVVQIVMSALGQPKEDAPRRPSKSRKNSTRKSTDSTKSDAKSPKPKNNSADEELNKDEENLSIAKKKKTKTKRKSNEQLNKTPEKPKQSQPKRGCRELENLNCTFKEYSDIFEKFILPTKDGKRLCTGTNSSRKNLEFSSSDSINENPKKTVKNVDSSKAGLAAPIGHRRQTCGELQTSPNDTNNSTDYSFRRSSDNGKSNRKNIHYAESSDETDEFDVEEHRYIKNELQKTYTNIDKDPFNPSLRVVLHKLSTNEIMKWVKCEEVKSKSTVLLMPTLIPECTKHTLINKNENNISKQDFGEKPILVPLNSKPVNTAKKTTPKPPLHLNNDIGMTLNSTKTCAICNKRPIDLTNHYVVQHQTESYTSRLTSAEIDNLEANITLAVRHRNRYKVTCIFCQAELEDNFVNFHAHFSYHTGEYGFKCAVCDLVKPYREDIRSHQYRTSTCLNGKIRSNYLYSPDLVVIYLYVCNLCNFVQLNEANIHKHQREHHGFRFDDPQNVKKCIIAALDNGEILNEVMAADVEEDELTSQVEKDSQNMEQEFLNEYPLDIKDVLLQPQEFPSTSQLALFENLLHDINTDNESLSATKAPSPKEGLDQLHASPSQDTTANIMTVIHTSSDKTCQESHKPYMEQVDEKPELKEIKSEVASDVPMVKSRMVYRQMPMGSNYFGMYKCTFNECWFSSNEASKFIQHISSVHNTNETKIFMDCAYCPYKSTKPNNIVKHVRAKHSLCRFQCSECAYRSTIPGNVAIHNKFYHKNTNSVKHIYECGSRLNQLDEKPYNLIQKMVENTKSLKCPNCSESFYAISSIKTHIHREHPLAFANLDTASFHELACLHCKEESSNKENMRIHLALDHPDEIGYVVQRKLKKTGCIDAVENLIIINISLPISPADVRIASSQECEIISNTTNTDDQTLFEDAPPAKIIKPSSPDITIEDDVLINTPLKTDVPNLTITEEETRLRPLLELLTENTGAPASSLYRCPECVASFLHSELWRKHIITRHKIMNVVSCPYCSKQFSLELAVIHFETHRRHEYICFHCVTSFCSREKICEHFASFHPEFRTTIERKIAYGHVSFSIFKEKDVALDSVNWLPLFQKLSDALRQQLSTKLQQNQQREWRGGLSDTCLEELEIPQYIANGLPRYKCLRRSCPFVGSDESTLDAHMDEHAPPDKYTCSHCDITHNNPKWKDIKDHKMLHKQEVYICGVCNFFHHTSAGMLKHIEQLHNIRDVPVIRVSRDELHYKMSLAFILCEKKMTFTTTDTCFCCLKVLKHKLVYHLKKEHKITLCPKCIICDAIILTSIDAELHAKVHESKPFRLKYEILTPFLYKAIVTSTSPFTIETQLIREKRPHDFGTTTAKKVKPNEDVPIKIKQEVVIKTECEEIQNEAPSGSIKCVNLENLMQSQTNSTQPSVISLRPISALTVENPHGSHSIQHSFIPNTTVLTNNTGQILSQNFYISPGITALPYPQGVQFEGQMPTNFIIPHQQLSIIEQPHETTFPPCLILPEFTPICGNCNFECSDFEHLKSHFAALHALKNERFLFRIARRVECIHCYFKCSLHILPAHHESAHPGRMRLCRSLTDPHRCGVCHEMFNCPPLSNNIQLPICACPTRQRSLADCLDLNTLKLLQNFGQNYLKYVCDICRVPFSQEQKCREHIVQVHKKASYPTVISKEMLFVCYSCEQTSTSIAKVIEHINKVHFPSLGELSVDLISSFYRKIKIIYPKGLTISAGDLKSTHLCHDIETFKLNLQNSEQN